MVKVIISKDFSETPGGRYVKDGDFSGEAFRDEILVPMFKKAVYSNVKILVDLDGTYGYATSFLDEAFGGLAEKFGPEKVLEHLQLKSEDEPSLVRDIEDYISSERKKF